MPKPWSENNVFQTTYFCNVHREDDKVTKWIRDYYSPFVDDPLFEYNIILSRFLNWPATLSQIGYLREHDAERLLGNLTEIAEAGKVWGNAYVITTHGIPMPKATYLCRNVLEGVHKALDTLNWACRVGQGRPTCAGASRALQNVEGIGSFLAGQVVADLKNTEGHPLKSATDWHDFVEPGPGSIRGASWFAYGEPNKVSMNTFKSHFDVIRVWVDQNWPEEVPPVHNQDLQNVLCEFDKYCRVSTGSGRSKRNYPGAA